MTFFINRQNRGVPYLFPLFTMAPQGDKSAYSAKQKRMASHIEQSEIKLGKSRKTAERIGWATVNKQTGGAHGKKRS